MCGITALFAYRSRAIERDELDAITARMIPRGPDAGGTWISPDSRLGLGSRRLAIIDLSDEGTQPMWEVARELVIVFNGEIYNYAELRASLERGGARFHSRTDTEVLLALYRRDGARMTELLRGMFAFAIWDTRSRRMFVARDPYGIKPLYLADDGATIRIASEVKALLAGGRVSETIDPAGAAGFFLTGSVPEPFTIRREVRAIEPGTSFFIDEERGITDERRYFSIAEIFRDADEDALVDPAVFVRERVEESVKHHLVSDVPVGVFLSAGIDSSALAKMASQIVARHTPLHTFTLSFTEFSEAPLAERFARELGAQQTTRLVHRDEFLGDLPRILERMDQPTIDGVNTWFISKAVHEAGIKVALSGVGGDELLGGYPSFRNIPRMVHFPRLATLAGKVRRHPKARLIAEYGGTYAGAYLLQRGLFLPDELPAILGDDLAREGLERLQPLANIERTLAPDPGTPFGRVATMEAALYMRNQLLRDADWASMAHSVEVRTPLVDVYLLRQLVPMLTKQRGKSALAANLPDYLRDRKKTGFFVPMKAWMDLPADGTSTRMRSWARRVWEAFR
ncbi:MAG: asparagine synthase (glutamine-hydrolyzing) [Thermoanaerobaculia bacterium]